MRFNIGHMRYKSRWLTGVEDSQTLFVHFGHIGKRFTFAGHIGKVLLTEVRRTGKTYFMENVYSCFQINNVGFLSSFRNLGLSFT